MAILPQEALQIISSLQIVKNKEIIPIEDSLFRISAEDINAPFSLPRYNNSAMDGYAIVFEDGNNTLKVVDKIFAGDEKELSIESGTCIKIMTGAKIPHNTTAIVPIEDVEHLDKKNIKITSKVSKNQHIRYIGEDILKDENILKDGDEINFAKITLLASMGITHIKVYKKPNILVFASGDELKQHYEKILPHQIYNSNTPTFVARCKELNVNVTFSKTSDDSLEGLKNIISNSLKYDLIITTGGVSVGEADFTKVAFGELGFNSLFDGIVIKPGKPTVFGKIGNSYVLNLPGNPLAAAMIFEMFGKNIIEVLKGQKAIHHNYIVAKLGKDIKENTKRVTLLAGFFDGEEFIVAKKTSPGMVSVLSACNSFIALDSGLDGLKKGQIVKVLPISWNFFTDKYKDFLSR